MAELLLGKVQCFYEEKWTVGNYLHFTLPLHRYFQVEKQRFTYIRRLGSAVAVVKCLTRDRGAPGLSLTGVTALWSLSKTHLS